MAEKNIYTFKLQDKKIMEESMDEIKFRKAITELFYYYERVNEKRNITMQNMFNYYKTWGYEDYFKKFSEITLIDAIEEWAKEKVLPPTIVELHNRCMEIDKREKNDKVIMTELCRILFREND